MTEAGKFVWVTDKTLALSECVWAQTPNALFHTNNKPPTVGMTILPSDSDGKWCYWIVGTIENAGEARDASLGRVYRTPCEPLVNNNIDLRKLIVLLTEKDEGDCSWKEIGMEFSTRMDDGYEALVTEPFVKGEPSKAVWWTLHELLQRFLGEHAFPRIFRDDSLQNIMGHVQRAMRRQTHKAWRDLLVAAAIIGITGYESRYGEMRPLIPQQQPIEWNCVSEIPFHDSLLFRKHSMWDVLAVNDKVFTSRFVKSHPSVLFLVDSAYSKRFPTEQQVAQEGLPNVLLLTLSSWAIMESPEDFFARIGNINALKKKSGHLEDEMRSLRQQVARAQDEHKQRPEASLLERQEAYKVLSAELLQAEKGQSLMIREDKRRIAQHLASGLFEFIAIPTTMDEKQADFESLSSSNGTGLHILGIAPPIVLSDIQRMVGTEAVKEYIQPYLRKFPSHTRRFLWQYGHILQKAFVRVLPILFTGNTFEVDKKRQYTWRTDDERYQINAESAAEKKEFGFVDLEAVNGAKLYDVPLVALTYINSPEGAAFPQSDEDVVWPTNYLLRAISIQLTQQCYDMKKAIERSLVVARTRRKAKKKRVKRVPKALPLPLASYIQKFRENLDARVFQ